MSSAQAGLSNERDEIINLTSNLVYKMWPYLSNIGWKLKRYERQSKWKQHFGTSYEQYQDIKWKTFFFYFSNAIGQKERDQQVLISEPNRSS